MRSMTQPIFFAFFKAKHMGVEHIIDAIFFYWSNQTKCPAITKIKAAVCVHIFLSLLYSEEKHNKGRDPVMVCKSKTIEAMTSSIITDARTVETLLQDMMEHADPYRLHGLQVIVEHQIACCMELTEMAMDEEVACIRR